ncbi:centromere/kinetochore protein zw10 homolog [Protopterus annectens]|uniref:centromere/kinetochore protein zw10 homolog n=1 Tax=Protopterus annectens TaxID=7888 RepID=UPI001CFC34F5|nr:centromere/kinetochore protein zw10 homolog [Protopterus annectens]
MSSFVTEILANSGKLEKEDLSTKIGKLSQRVDEIKDEVCEMINKKYEEFLPTLNTAEELVVQVHGLTEEIDLLKSRVETEVQRDVRTAITEFSELKRQLERNTILLRVLKQLQVFDSGVEKFQNAFQAKDYVEAARHIEKAEKSLKVLRSRQDFEPKILKSLHTELVVQKQNIIYHLGQEWEKLVVWKLSGQKETANLDVETVLKTELHLCTAVPKGEETGSLIASVLEAFTILGQLNTRLRFFSHLLLKYILKPLILYPVLHLNIMEDQETQTSVLQFEKMLSSQEHPSPPEVYIKVMTVLEHLHKHLFDVPFSDSEVEDRKPKVALTEALGDMIWEELSDCIIRDCLVYSIPTNSNQLEKYEVVIKATEDFEKALKNIHFLKNDATALLKYARNVNTHFASKKCQDVVVAARNLMTSEMHNTVKITPESKITLPKMSTPSSGDKLKAAKVAQIQCAETGSLENEKQVSQYTFSMPACRISETVHKLMELAYQTLSEATSSNTQCAVQLFYTTRNIFHLFYDVVPTYHKENLQKLPQLTAIHHNNCMYIAHHLLTLGHQFRYKLPPPLCDGAATFVDLVQSFRRLGTECFLAQMRTQKAELLERLSSVKNFSNLDEEDNYMVANKAVRQVIHHLKRLGKVWQDVLPVTIYCKAMGTLLNTTIMEIANRVTALEDISTEDGDRIYSLCKIMVEEGPQIFTPLAEENKNKTYQEEVPLYVPKWMKFKELMIVLQASLQELVDRWADGKGPLATEFSSTEIKSLIRALFQNTERRAAALNRIK